MTELREPQDLVAQEVAQERGGRRPPSSAPPRALAPTRDREATLSALVDSLLTKGVYLDLDAVITVAGIPLIGLSLRAALAGMETLLEYGMFEDWDERTRAWARRSAPPGLQLADGEEIRTRMPGAYRLDAPLGPVWQPGTVFLTDRRLLVYRSEPATMLWEVPLGHVAHVGKVSERSIGGEDVPRLIVTTDDGGVAHLSAARPDRLRDLLLRSRPARGPAPVLASEQPPSEETGDDELWFEETRASGRIWRRGVGASDREAFRWRGDGDRRAAVRIALSDVLAVRREKREGAPDGLEPFVVVLPDGEAHFAAVRAEEWQARIRRMAGEEVDDEHSEDR
jgi:hypothetical protein